MNTKRTITRATGVAAAVAVLLSGWAVYAERSDPTSAEEPAASEKTSDVVARVNGEAVMRAEVDAAIDALFGGQLAGLPEKQREGMRAQVTERVVDEMIVEKLLAQAANEQAVAVGDDEIQSSIQKISATLPPGKSLAEVATAAGTSEDALKSRLATSLRIEKLLGEKAGEVAKPTDEEVASYYEEKAELFEMPERVQARHVLIAFAPSDDADAKNAKRAKAEKVRAELANAKGENFAKVAAESSDCPSKERGGELGAFARGDTVPAFEEAAFSQEIGAIGPVVETDFGFHVVQVQKRDPAGKAPFDEVREMIAERMMQEKQQAAVAKYIDGLRADAKIDHPAKDAA